jgi:hypothetical protein
MLGLAVAALAAAAVAGAPAAGAAPADPPGTQCARYVWSGHYQLGHLEYNAGVAFEAGLDVPRIVRAVTGYVGDYMTEYTYCDKYSDVKTLINQGNAALPAIDAVAESGGNLAEILATAAVAQSCYRQAETLAWAKKN